MTLTVGPRPFEALALPGQECGSREKTGHTHTPVTHGSWNDQEPGGGRPAGRHHEPAAPHWRRV